MKISILVTAVIFNVCAALNYAINTRSTRDFTLPRSTEWGQTDPGYY